MRKYAIPKTMYIALIAILLCFSVGYTYAYFSATKVASASLTLGYIDVTWRDGNNGDAAFSSTETFDKESTTDDESLAIGIIGEITRGGYAQITAKNVSDQTRNIMLKMANINGTVGAYCRIKIDATYTPAGSTEIKQCEDGWVQLAMEQTLITLGDWCEYNGYYYYGSKTTTTTDGVTTTTFELTELSKKGGVDVANYLYLSPESSTELYDATLSIIVRLEAIQTTNNACEHEWGITLASES
ncbi:MAG: hypothetical protein IJ358_01375 [Clostridia bacterium]|nr:hypothetical protein [Clostridia bacterium]